MRRKVTPLTAKRAFLTIKVVAQAVLDGERAITYSDLARRLGMPNESGRGLGPVLDEAAAKCREHELPNVTVLIVTKSSIASGTPMPSDQSFDREDRWVADGLDKSEIPLEQERARTFDWAGVRSLNLEQESPLT